MKAIVCPRYGPPEVLEQREVADPKCKEDEVLINIKATTVVQADIRVRGFHVPPSFWVPARLALGITRPKKTILGTELAGVVQEVGARVSRFKVGDKIFALLGHEMGCHAELRCAPEDGIIAHIPAGLSLEQAAAIPMGGSTAMYFLKKADLKKGQRVLIYGASGSIGTYAVQLAKHLGAKVTGVCSARNIELVRSLGADEVIDYTKDDFSLGDGIYDVVFDTVGKASIKDCVRALRDGGHYLQAVGTPGMLMRMRRAARAKSINVVGGTSNSTADELASLGELAAEGRVVPVIDRTYPLDKIVEAHRYVESGHKKGNVVITI